MLIHPDTLIEKTGFGQIRRAAASRAQSDMARENLAELRPSSDRSLIRESLEKCREMMHLLQFDAAFPLANLHDLRHWLSRSNAEESILPLEAFVEIREVSVTARRVKSFLEDRREEYPQLTGVAGGIVPLKELEKSIGGKISDQGELRSDASRELQQIRGKMNRRRTDLRSTINRVMSKAAKDGMVSDEGPTIRSGRMVIPILAEYKRKIQGFVHDVSSTGQTVYLEPVEALQINNEIRSLESEEKREIDRILRQLTASVRGERDGILRNLEVLTAFDILSARARLSADLDGYIPVVSERDHLYLREAYNPLLLLKNLGLKKEEREEVVPLDLELEEKERCLIITGPNAGGKSVAMKTLGLCVMMVQSGFAIPARDSSELPVYGELFVDMGDDQSIENDLSTFSSRLEWMRHTMDKAGERSLVLIDEAAAGTDPEEGGALFRALIESMIGRQARVLVTTHHGSLKIFAHEEEQAVNGSMEFDQSTLSPTYRFRKGIPGSSYAFEIADRMEVDRTLLSRARELVGTAKSDLESLITELETRTQEAAELKEKYNALKARMEAERNRYEEKRSSIEKERDTIREKALKEASEIMESANRRIEEAVEMIMQQGEGDKETIRKARRNVESHRQEVGDELEDLDRRKKERRKDSEDPPREGDTVRLQDGNTTGELAEINGSDAVVLSGGLRLKTKFDNLVKVEDAGKRNEKQKISVNVVGREGPPSAKPSLNIRGMRGPEAVQEVTHYLDNALAGGLNKVEIIHGKGEGILRKLVHEHLEQRSDVKRYEIAPIEQGGAGCTIVHL